MTTLSGSKAECLSGLRQAVPIAARLLLATLTFLLGSCDDDYTAVPVVESIDPFHLVRGQQNSQVTILGHSFLSSGTTGVSFDYGNADGISGTVVEVHDTYIILNLSVSNTAELGHHRLTVYSPNGDGVGEMIVQCNPPGSCPPEPYLMVTGALYVYPFGGGGVTPVDTGGWKQPTCSLKAKIFKAIHRW